MKKHQHLSWIIAAAGLVLALGMVSFWLPARASNVNQTALEYYHYLPIVSASSCVPGPPIAPDDPERDLAVEDEINQERNKKNIARLEDSIELSQAALRHSNDMADNNFFDHIGSDGTRAGDRLDAACYNWQAYGEIIAAGYTSPSSVVTAWMNSSLGHKEIILNTTYKDFGSGYAYNLSSDFRHYWTVDFGLLTPEPYSAPVALHECSYHLKDAQGELWISLFTSESCDHGVDQQGD